MNNHSRVLRWSLVIGIVIVLNLFFNYALSLVYHEPQYQAFCPMDQVVEQITNQDSCLAVGGQWNQNVYPKAGTNQPEVSGYCDPQFTCRNSYDAAQKTYDRNVFATLVVLGALSVVGGMFLRGSMVLSQALSLGGVLSFVIASMRYWSSADNLVKVVILAIALVLLVWVALKKFRE